MALLKLFALVVCLSVYITAQEAPLASTFEEPFAKQVLAIMISKIMLLEYKNVLTKEGYNFNYRTSDGSYREEVGMILNPGTDQEELVVMGSYSYIENGTEYITMYTADKNGYKARVEFKKTVEVGILSISPKLLQNLSG